MINIKRTHITGTYTRGKRTYHFDVVRNDEFAWVLTTDDARSDCYAPDDEAFVSVDLEGCRRHLAALEAGVVA